MTVSVAIRGPSAVRACDAWTHSGDRLPLGDDGPPEKAKLTEVGGAWEGWRTGLPVP